MAIGDDAAAAGMELVPSSGATGSAGRVRQGWQQINKTRDYIAQFINTLRTQMNTALGGKIDKPSDGALMARREPGSAHSIGFYTQPSAELWYRPDPTTATYDRKVITQNDLDSAVSGKASTGDVTNAQNAANAANSTATAARAGNLTTDPYNRNLGGNRRSAWLQDDGLLGYAASSERYKKNIRPEQVTDEQLLALQLVSYQWRAAVAVDDRREMGLIAERVEDAGLGWAAFYDADGRVEGLNYEMIGIALLPVVQRLITRVAALEAKP